MRFGVDYDKPSHIFNCKTCNEHFQNPVFTYNCIDCGKVSDIRHLQEHLIKRVSLTAKGKQLVLSGLPKKKYEVETNKKGVSGVYELNVFKNILQQEKARTKFNPGKTFFGRVTIVDPQLNSISWKEKMILRDELAGQLKSYLNDYDKVTAVSAGEFYFLKLESNVEQLEDLKELIKFNLEALVKSNVEDSQIVVSVKIQAVFHDQTIEM